MKNIKICKKCGAELPSDAKYDLCANCRGEHASQIRRIGGIVISGTIVALSIVSKLLNTSKIEDNNDQDINGLDNDQESF